jgi:hypothetical protein
VVCPVRVKILSQNCLEELFAVLMIGTHVKANTIGYLKTLVLLMRGVKENVGDLCKKVFLPSLLLIQTQLKKILKYMLNMQNVLDIKFSQL